MKDIIEMGGFNIEVALATYAEYVPRQVMERGVVHSAQWCDTGGMAAYGHTEGSIDLDVLLQLMEGMQ
eukprot:7622369-Pyramimonas_sp.AAC.1